MGKSVHTIIACVVLVLSIAQAGMFPVLPGEQVFPFSIENSIVPDFPPVEKDGIIEVAVIAGQGGGNLFVFNGRLIQGFIPDWLANQDLLQRIKIPELRQVLYRWVQFSMVAGLESVQIIFPFHEFW